MGKRGYRVNNPYGRQGKVGYLVSSLFMPTLGVVLLSLGFIGWGIAILVIGILGVVFSFWFVISRSKK